MMSERESEPTSTPLPSTTGAFLMRFSASRRHASSSSEPDSTDMAPFVAMRITFRSMSSVMRCMKFSLSGTRYSISVASSTAASLRPMYFMMSPSEMKPTTRLRASTTGTPLVLLAAKICATSRMVSVSCTK